MYLILVILALFILSQCYFSMRFFCAKSTEETRLKKGFIGLYFLFQVFFSLWFILFLILDYLGSIRF